MTLGHYPTASTGIWYSPGVKANALFFDKKAPAEQTQTKALWDYDFRTNVHKALKTKRLNTEDLNDFVHCYQTRKETDRFRRLPIEGLLKRHNLNLDLFWLKDDSLEDIDSLPDPDVPAGEIAENLQAALESFAEVAGELRLSD